MVYIRINQKIQALLPKHLPKFVTLIQLDNDKYLSYKDFKQLIKKLKIQLHKHIPRKDIIPESQIRHKMQLRRRTPLENKVIEQLKNRQQYKKNNPSLSDQISFLCNQAIYQTKSQHISDQLYSAGKVIFGMCMSSIVGYFVAENGLGLEPLWSLCIGGLSAGGVYLCNMIGKNTIKGFEKNETIKKSKRTKQSQATIQFSSGRDNLTTINSKGRLKHR